MQRDRELRGRGMRPIEARVSLARHACRLCHRMLKPKSPSMRSATLGPGTRAGGDGVAAMPREGAI